MSDHELRKEMIMGVIDEMRGPRFNINEVVKYNPATEYLVGTVIPMDWKPPIKDNRTMDDLDSVNINDVDYVGSDDSNSGIDNVLGNNSPILNPNSQIRSFGLSFMVDSQENISLDICVTWGRYFKDEDSEEGFSLNGVLSKRQSDDLMWKRESFGEVRNVNVDNSFKKGKKIRVYESDDGLINLFIKRQELNENKSHISIYLINNLNVTTNKKKSRPEAQDCLFQPSIRVNLKDSKKLVGMDTFAESNDELDFLYRNKPVLATGHLCSVIWSEIDYYKEFKEDYKNLIWPDESAIDNSQDFIEPTIRTEFLPLYPINLPNFDIGDVDLELRANKLAYSTQNELYDNLLKLHDSYSDWINDNVSKRKSLPEKYLKISKDIIENEKEALRRIEEGIELIKSEELVYLAFCFANKTIHLQDEWKRGINTDVKTDLSDGCDEYAFKWRAFQLAFILINLESIWNENSENKSVLDLLWIPTGGGKTEAYLGIMAFTMALRRLKAKCGLIDEKTGAGVSIISRYTLRLLTVQQFRRTLRMVTAAEYLRVYKSYGNIGWRNSNSLSGDWIYGSVRFSVGMWVGGSVTPLHLNKDEIGAIDILKSDGSEGYGNPAQVMKCPVCGSWLSIPDEGLTDIKNHVHIIVYAENSSKDEIQKDMDEFEEKFIEKIKVSDKTNKKDYYIISIYFNRKVKSDEYKVLIGQIYDGYKSVSLNKMSPGYIVSQDRVSSYQKRFETDYEIWCTNPECSLNHDWKEGVPFSNNEVEFPDGNYLRLLESPFKNNSKIPIPAYLIDEHVYYRCPTVLVSTADKIARLAFEPRAGSIFGVVNKYHKNYGYYRNELLPENSSTYIKDKFIEIKSLLPPDLIIQDELHLMNGPLGSLFGLYENMVDAIIKKQGGNPKYIASTATINNAEKQVKLLFSKKVSQFPPYGLDIADSFFVKDFSNDYGNMWDENNRGRVYMGVYSSGFGHFTHQIRLYSRLLRVANDNLDNDKLKYYWTIVGYYNAIKELGSGVALYKDDILSRLKNISYDPFTRKLKPEDDNLELSSRIDSTNLPIILDELERDGENKPPNYNAIFTTSMFGTGVDISHLSIMIMNAQPKTTGDYIQATGRIGRNHGGLIIDLLRSGRPRDLNHYELFSSYHSRINREVEPISVSPFSEGCLLRGLGPSLVSFLRNVGDAEFNLDENPLNISLDDSKKYVDLFKESTKKRLENMDFSNKEIRNILTKIDEGVSDWKNLVKEMDDGGNILEYHEKFSKFHSPSKNVVLGDPAHDKIDGLEVVYKNAPMSLRDIEDTLEFWV